MRRAFHLSTFSLALLVPVLFGRRGRGLRRSGCRALALRRLKNGRSRETWGFSVLFDLLHNDGCGLYLEPAQSKGSMAKQRKLFITHAGELAHRLVRAVRPHGMIADFAKS